MRGLPPPATGASSRKESPGRRLPTSHVLLVKCIKQGRYEVPSTRSRYPSRTVRERTNEVHRTLESHLTGRCRVVLVNWMTRRVHLG